MDSLILVIEHRRCRCGNSFTAPNPQALTRRKLTNLHAASILSPNPLNITPHPLHRETIHVEIEIDYCPACFYIYNGFQLELFPRVPLPPITFTAGTIALAKAKTKLQQRKSDNPYGLHFF